MAKIDLKFLDATDDCWIRCNVFKEDMKHIEIQMYNEYTLNVSSVFLDKSTAIKFAKTLRTEINKIVE